MNVCEEVILTVDEPLYYNSHIFLLGCFGYGQCQPGTGQHNVSKLMKRIVKEKPNFKYIISLGDNIYEKKLDEDIWLNTIENCYKHLELPILVCLGNHEYSKFCPNKLIEKGSYMLEPDCSIIKKWYEKPKDEIDWILPSRYWSLKQHIQDNEYIYFIFLDTTIFTEYNEIPKEKNVKNCIYKAQGWNPKGSTISIEVEDEEQCEPYPPFKKGCKVKKATQISNCLFSPNSIPLIQSSNDKKCKLKDQYYKHLENYEMNLPFKEWAIPYNQITWLKNLLKKIEKDEQVTKIIVIGHHPIFGNGHKEGRPAGNKWLQKNIYEDIFLKYNNKNPKKRIVSYICADEHNFQYLYDKENDFNLFIAGIGGAKLDTEIFDTSNLTVFNQSPVHYGSFYCQIKKSSIIYTVEEIRDKNKKNTIFIKEISDL